MSECPNICGEELKPLTNACALDAQLLKARREIAENSKPKKIESLRKFYVKDCPDCVGTGINPNGFFHSACPYCSGRGHIPL